MKRFAALVVLLAVLLLVSGCASPSLTGAVTFDDSADTNASSLGQEENTSNETVYLAPITIDVKYS